MKQNKDENKPWKKNRDRKFKPQRKFMEFFFFTFFFSEKVFLSTYAYIKTLDFYHVILWKIIYNTSPAVSLWSDLRFD